MGGDAAVAQVAKKKKMLKHADRDALQAGAVDITSKMGWDLTDFYLYLIHKYKVPMPTGEW
jgi:hypothetical protein